jgi:hypothetical protein
VIDASVVVVAVADVEVDTTVVPMSSEVDVVVVSDEDVAVGFDDADAPTG